MSEHFDYDLLKKRMKLYRHNQTTLAEEMDVSRKTINAKLNGSISFTQPDIVKICEILDIPRKQVGNYFYKSKEE